MVRTRYTLESHKDKVIGLILQGTPGREVARQFKVSETAVRMFKRRHADVLIPAKDALVEAVVDLSLSTVEGRVRELAWLYETTKQEAVDYGITVTEVDFSQNGESRTETREFRAPLVKEMRGIVHDIAEQLHQLDKGTINIDARTQVLIRQVTGAEVPLG